MTQDARPLSDETEEFLFIAMDDDGKAHPTRCKGRGAVVDAVNLAVWGEPTLDEDARMESAGITDSLIEDGIFRFEGDPSLHLFRLASQRAPLVPTTALREAINSLHVLSTRDDLDDPDRAWIDRNEVLALLAAPLAPTQESGERDVHPAQTPAGPSSSATDLSPPDRALVDGVVDDLARLLSGPSSAEMPNTAAPAALPGSKGSA